MDLNATLRLAMAAERCLPHEFESLHEAEQMCRRLTSTEAHRADLSKVVSIVKGVRDKRSTLRTGAGQSAKEPVEDGLNGNGLTLQRIVASL